MEARVLKSTGSWYVLETDQGEVLNARLRGRLRQSGLSVTNPIAAGDRVTLKSQVDEEGNYVIADILPRANYVVRKSTNLSKQMQILAANVDQMFLVVTLLNPKTQSLFVDRFLVSTESFRIPTTLLFNKTDLYSDEHWNEFNQLKTMYEAIGYPCIPIEAKDRDSVMFLHQLIQGKQVMLGGNSGVGKSTLVNALDATIHLKMGEISEVHMQGKHTTTFAEMYKFANGGYLIDTPGIRSFGLIEVEKTHLGHYFPEIRKEMEQCKFNNCVHFNEPKCAVIDAVEKGNIALQRYQNYLSILLEKDTSPYRYNSHE